MKLVSLARLDCNEYNCIIDIQNFMDYATI